MVRRVLAIAVAGAGALVLVIPIAGGIPGASAGLAAALNAAELIGLRSPGVRGGDPVRTKAARVASAHPARPSERVLSEVREPPHPARPADGTLPEEIARLIETDPGPLPLDAPAFLLTGPLGDVVGSGGNPPTISGVGTPQIILDGAPPGPPSQPPLPPVPPPAVPEPSTWLLMLGGFGLIGHMLRRSPSRVIPAPV